jgi:hypothetical protein
MASGMAMSSLSFLWGSEGVGGVERKGDTGFSAG